MIRLVLLRHGESVWNKENRFTGWTNVGLTELGVSEAKNAGKTLSENGFEFDVVFTSVLKRATDTTNLVAKQMGLKPKIIDSWRLNERHYGALQGLNKSEMAAKYGEEQVLKWRRSFDVRPPALEKTDKRWPGNESKYKELERKFLPVTESLKDCIERVRPFWEKEILSEIRKGSKVLVSASGNSLRALVKLVDKISDDEIVSFNIPTAVPLVYELDERFRPIKHYFLGNEHEINAKMRAVAAQGKLK